MTTTYLGNRQRETGGREAGSWSIRHKWTLSTALIKLIGGSAFLEFSSIGILVSSWPTEVENALKWTIFRVPFLGHGDAKPVVASFKGSGLDGMFLNRKSMVDWVLAKIPKDDWVGRAPCLSH